MTFKFSTTKTVCLHFCRLWKLHPDPQLSLSLRLHLPARSRPSSHGTCRIVCKQTVLGSLKISSGPETLQIWTHWTITSRVPCWKSTINSSQSLRRLLSWKSICWPPGKSCHKTTSTRRRQTSPSPWLPARLPMAKKITGSHCLGVRSHSGHAGSQSGGACLTAGGVWVTVMSAHLCEQNICANPRRTFELLLIPLPHNRLCEDSGDRHIDLQWLTSSNANFMSCKHW